MVRFQFELHCTGAEASSLCSSQLRCQGKKLGAQATALAERQRLELPHQAAPSLLEGWSCVLSGLRATVILQGPQLDKKSSQIYLSSC